MGKFNLNLSSVNTFLHVQPPLPCEYSIARHGSEPASASAERPAVALLSHVLLETVGVR